MATVESIIALSSEQCCTCMYSVEELEAFSPEKLDNVYWGIVVLGKTEEEL